MGDGYDLRPRFRVEWRDEATARRVWVFGQVDLAAVDQLRDALSGEQPRVEVDLSGVTFMDASGVGCLVGATETRGVTLVAISDAVDRILELTDTAKDFDVRYQ